MVLLWVGLRITDYGLRITDYFVCRWRVASNRMMPQAMAALSDSVCTAIGMVMPVLSCSAFVPMPLASLPIISADGCCQSTVV